MKKILLILFLLLVIIGIYFAIIQKEEDDGPVLTLYGNVDIRDVSLGFRVTGRVDAMHVEEGDIVKTNDLLASLDAQPFMDELTLRKAELAVAQAILSNKEKDYKRVAKLVISGAVSRSDHDDALAKRDEALAVLDSARARLALAQTQLEDTQLLAPSDGIILTRVRERGAVLMQGAPIYSMALLNPVWVRTYVDEPQLGRIYSGQKARITTDSGDSYEGQIGFISPQAEFTPKTVETTSLRTDLVYRLRVVVNDPDNGLRQGMPVTITIEKRIPQTIEKRASQAIEKRIPQAIEKRALHTIEKRASQAVK